MPPTPQEHHIAETIVSSRPEGERVVVSGISGAYPESENLKQMFDILYSKESPINDTNPRWKYEHPELPKHLGKIPGLQTFDAQFFKVHYRLGNNMDPMSRKLLEQSYQAIYDAGLSPEHLSGKKIGVYVGSCFSETEKACFYVASGMTGFGIAGCSKAMFANRISYWLNAKGPSMSIDAACSSSMVALEKAYEAITRGDCEAAIVGAANICLHPQSSVHFGRVIQLCFDGKTKSFAKNADGCARSEAINVLFLQKAKNANRIYGDICYVKSKFEPMIDDKQKQVYGPMRDIGRMTDFMNTFYKDAGIPPSAVEYVEAYGSATPEADKNELEAIDRVFCKDRTDPLLVGSVMSNLGYAEAASGITAITKVLLGYHTGKMAANLNCDEPRDDVVALKDGRIKIVTDHEPIRRSYAAVNSFSVTGMNAHVLLNGHYKPKDPNRYKSNIPYLVLVSGRQESAVQKVLNDLKSRPIDPEEIALIHNIHEKSPSGHLGRGFTILGTNEENATVSLAEKSDYCDNAKRPLWFVYSGMGSQWVGMGVHLMRIPIFAAAIQRCHKVLEPKGVNIVDIITSPEKTMFDNILHSFVGIAAVQIGLTDVLKAMGIVPDKIIGHSVGELGCAYADGCFTAEEMILSAYSRGLVSVQTPFIKGSMAAVGMGYQQIKSKCPPEIEVACHNAAESCTISGPADIMKEFVAKLTEQGIFAKEVPCSNIAYHSRYIKEAGPGLLKYLSEVITSPKERSDKWVSTSVPQDKWEEPAAKYSSAEYHTNNLLSPVLFEETSRLIPSNAVLVEIAPHGLLQAILKRSLSVSCIHVPLTRRGHTDNAVFMLEAVGKLFMQGYNPLVKALYPRVEFPVSTGTPMLSHFVEWAHNEKWSLPLYLAARRKKAAEAKYVFSVSDDDHKYLTGHVIRNANVYPYSGALVCAWDTLAMFMEVDRRSISVMFREVHLHSQPEMPEDTPLRMHVQIQKGSGYFEVMNEETNTKVVSGYIETDNMDPSVFALPTVDEVDAHSLTSNDVYRTFFDRGSDYRGEFRSIKSANSSLTNAQVTWNDNWVAFIDSLIQINALRNKKDVFAKPKFIQKLFIDVQEHGKVLEAAENKGCVEANVISEHDVTRCGGLAMIDIKFDEIPPVSPKPVSLKALEFVPYFQLNNTEVQEALNIFVQIVAENLTKTTINVLELVSSETSSTFEYEFTSLADEVHGINVVYQQIDLDKIGMQHVNSLQNADLVITRQLNTGNQIGELLFKTARAGIFVLTTDSPSNNLPSSLSRNICSTATPRGRLALSRWKPARSTAYAAISVNDAFDLSMLKATRDTMDPEHTLIVLTKYPAPHGLKELVQSWRSEANSRQVYVAMINSRNPRDVNLDQLPDFDLAFNVLKDGCWGGEFFLRAKENVQNKAVTLRSQVFGDLDSLHWEEIPEAGDDDVAVTVHYTGLNIRDAKKATGVVTYKNEKDLDTGYGMDFSGVTKSGERVMGLVTSGAASSVIKNPLLMWPVPSHWTLEDAATVPLPYLHALYCLYIKCEMVSGSRILVHGATGGLGQAVITIALAHGCEVFATVSDMKKKRFLRMMFPEIPEDHIGNSRDLTFRDLVLTTTKGKGCNIVISCLKPDLKNLALQCCGRSGVFLDTHQLVSREHYMYGMFNLTKERHYQLVDFHSIFEYNNVDEIKELHILLGEGIARGYVRPLSRVTYNWSEASRALRLLAASKHRGRALLSIKGDIPVSQPRINTTATGTHVVVATNEDKSLALRVADTLVARGAKNIILNSDGVDGYLHLKTKSWQEQGVQVELSTKSLTDITNVEEVVKSGTMGPVEGVFVVNSGDFNQKEADVMKILENLDTVSRKWNSVKYFSVINEKSDIGRDVCINRFYDQLPANVLVLPSVDKFAEVPKELEPEESISTVDAVKVLEHSIRTNKPVVLAHTSTPAPQTLIQHVSFIAGVTITENTPDNITLEQLGIEKDRLRGVSLYLAQNLNLAVNEEDVPSLNVNKLRQLQQRMDEDSQECVGMGSLFSHVVPDELTATTEVWPITTLTHHVENDFEIDTSETYLTLVPGLDGHHYKFTSLCERLKLPAVLLQYGFENAQESVREMAERMAKLMMNKLKLKDNFYLLGYSFGAIVAMEIASILEEQGLTGVVFCVDAEPDTYKAKLEKIIGCSGDELQNSLIHQMYTLMMGTSSPQLAEDLKEIPSWNDKINLCLRSMRGKVPHSNQYARLIIETAYSRIQTARTFNSRELIKKPLKSQLIYIRSKESTEDITLGKYSERPIIVYEINKSHGLALEDLQSSNIVNKHLDKEVLDKFFKRSLVTTYLLNATTFMGNADELEKLE